MAWRRSKTGQIIWYINRTYRVLPTDAENSLQSVNLTMPSAVLGDLIRTVLATGKTVTIAIRHSAEPVGATMEAAE